jgi:hypothetical protein
MDVGLLVVRPEFAPSPPPPQALSNTAKLRLMLVVRVCNRLRRVQWGNVGGGGAAA